MSHDMSATAVATAAGSVRPAEAVSVRGVEAANILPAGVTRKRQQLKRPTSSPKGTDTAAVNAYGKNGQDQRKALLAKAIAQNVQAPAEFRAYPFPPPAYPIAYPASEPAPDPRFYRSQFDDFAERERKRETLPVRHRLIRRFESERGPLAPPKKRVSSTSVAVAAATAAAASIAAAAHASGTTSAVAVAAGAATPGLHLLDADGYPYDMSQRMGAPSSPNLKPSLPQRGRPRKRAAPAGPVRVPSKRRPTARHVNANAWWKRPVRATTPDLRPGQSSLRTTSTMMRLPNLSTDALPGPEAMPALPPLPALPMLPALSAPSAPSKGKRAAASKRRPRPSPSLSRSGFSTPFAAKNEAIGGPNASYKSSTIKSESEAARYYLPPGSVVSTQAMPPVLSSIPALPGHVNQIDVDTAKDRFPAEVKRAPTKKESALAQCAGLNAAMFAPMSNAINQGAMMNKAMFGSAMGAQLGAGLKVGNSVGNSYDLQCTIDSLRVERHKLWKKEMKDLEKEASKRLELTLTRGEHGMDKQFRHDLGARLWRAGKDTQVIVRHIVDEDVDGNSSTIDDDAHIDDESIERLMLLDGVRLMMCSLLLELEYRPTDEYWKARKKQKLLAKKITKARRELNRIASVKPTPVSAKCLVPLPAAAPTPRQQFLRHLNRDVNGGVKLEETC